MHQPARDDTFMTRRKFLGDKDFDTTGAVNFLKATGHPGRLAILRYLTSGEKSVSTLEALMNTRQAAVSQQLARLRRKDDLLLSGGCPRPPHGGYPAGHVPRALTRLHAMSQSRPMPCEAWAFYINHRL